MNRRKFIQSASAATLIACNPELASAAFHGSSALNASSRVTLNVPNGTGFINLAKGWQFPAVDPTLLSSDGYFINTPAGSFGGNMPLPFSYYGQYVWSFSGAASMQISPPAIIYSGAQFISGLGSPGTGITGGNTSILASQGANPRVVLKFGSLVTGVSGGSGSLVTITTASLNFGSGLATGTNVTLNQGVSSNLANGPNSDGSWTITNVDGSHFTLNNSTGVISPTVTAAGGVGVQSEAVMGNISVNPTTLNSGVFSGWSNLIFCKAANEAAVLAGQNIDATLVSQFRFLLNPNGVAIADAWLRFMDWTGVQTSFEGDFSQRIPVTSMTFSATNLRPGYWAGAISSSSGGVTYTASDPSISVWSGTAYIDNAIVQGTPDVNNVGATPTLNVGGHGAKPVFDFNATPFIIGNFSVAPSAGLSMVFTFSATWLNGGSSYPFTYTTTTTGPFGNDTASVSALSANLKAAMAADTTLIAGGIQFSNSGSIGVFPRTPQAGRLSLSYTSGPAIVGTIGNHFANGITGATPGTFIFNYLLDGWIYRSGGMTNSVPFEVMAELCNRVGAHAWFNWGITKGVWITAVTGFFRDNLNAGLKFGAETGNEVWNPGANPFAQYDSIGKSMNFLITSNQASYGYTSLRTIQYQALALAAWTTTRPASTLYTFQMAQTGATAPNGDFDTFQLKGTQLVTTNTVYANYGGLNGADGSTAPVGNHNASPSRPVDITTAIGMAPYWGSPWWDGAAAPGPNGAGVNGTVTQNAPWLQASLDFTNGLTATAYTSLVNQFNGTTTRSGGTSDITTLPGYQTLFTGQENTAAQYDSGRGALGLQPLAIMEYEGGPNWAMGADNNNGVNSVNSTDIAALANQITALSWNVSPYTVSGTNNATEVATQVITMIIAWKSDPSYDTLIKTNYYQALKNTSGAHRETKAAQFGYQGGQWGLFPGFYDQSSPYSSYTAMHEFNS